MIEVILSRLESTHDNLRTDDIYGITAKLPEVGNSFKLLGKGLTADTVRAVSTTPVKEIRRHIEEGSLEFWTDNSHYGLQLLDMETEGEAS